MYDISKFRGIKGQPFVPKTVTKYWRDQTPYYGKDKFVDDFFPPTEDSILSTKCIWSEESRKQLQKYGKWNFIRPELYLGNDYCVYDEKLSQNDIKQGMLGDCYFLSSLAAMTEFPGLMNLNFKFGPKKSENGYYEILMFIDEEWQIVIVDDFIPSLSGHQTPTFAQTNRNVIWPLLIEKAWAKINDGYSNTVSGKASWPLHVLTGFPCSLQDFLHIDKEQLWENIKFHDLRNDIMVCGSSNEGKGIIRSHAYTLISALEVLDSSGNKIRLICLRNPWGSHEWTGDWCDTSDKWTPELRKQVHLVTSDDGVFWMSYTDFLEYFSDMDFANTPNYFKNVHLFTHTDNMPKVYNIKAESASTLTVNVFSNDNLPMNASVFLSKVAFAITNWDASLIYSSSSYDGRIFNLTPGNYTIAIYPHCENIFSVKFSNNGEYKVRPKFSYDKEYSYLTNLKTKGNISKQYLEQINGKEFEKLFDSLPNNSLVDKETFCKNPDKWEQESSPEFYYSGLGDVEKFNLCMICKD
jgi:hypothetical protein